METRENPAQQRRHRERRYETKNVEMRRMKKKKEESRKGGRKKRDVTLRPGHAKPFNGFLLM